jgi:hypothetical protein
MPIDVNAIFEEELSRRGCTFIRDDENTYRVHVNGWDVTARLDNIRRNAERDQDPDAIRRFVDTVLETGASPQPPWSEASTLLFWSAEPRDREFGDTIRFVVTDEVSRVLTLTDAEQSKVTGVTPDMCDEWGVTAEHAAEIASRNQDRLLAGIELETTDIGGDALGMVPLGPAYKSSVIFAPSFRRLVEPALGWPVLAVLPCRDFIYVVADGSPLLGRIGLVVVEQFRSAGYPITTEVLRISDDGIDAIGHFEP